MDADQDQRGTQQQRQQHDGLPVFIFEGDLLLPEKDHTAHYQGGDQKPVGKHHKRIRCNGQTHFGQQKTEAHMILPKAAQMIALTVLFFIRHPPIVLVLL